MSAVPSWPFIAFFGLAGSMLVALAGVAPGADLNVLAMSSQGIAATLVWLGYDLSSRVSASAQQPSRQSVGLLGGLLGLLVQPWKTMRNQALEAGWALPLTVVGVNALLGILGTVLLVDRLDLDAYSSSPLPVGGILLAGGTLNILSVQLGGWVVQSFLVFCMVVILDGQGAFGEILRVVGRSYIGFVLSTAVLLGVMMLRLPANATLEQLSSLSAGGHAVAGKVGELWVLSLLCYGLAVGQRFSVGRSLAAGLLPSGILLGSRIAFGVLAA